MRLIDADAVLDYLKNLEPKGGNAHYRDGCNDMLHDFFPKIIQEAPTIEPHVVRGHWIEPVLMHCEYGCMCSNCEKFNDIPSDFCPNCFADMRGEP